MNACPFCRDVVKQNEIVLENELCLFLQREEGVLIGSGLIIPRAHRETAFDLTSAEWNATQTLLLEVKAHLDRMYQPAGYNLGWNCGATAGQEVFHAHLHVIPRYMDEPYAGRGIRHWLKQEANRRKCPPSKFIN
jgi:diadenosine tetraphosphate (Ap4A) HIT family hydrolase